MEGQQKEELLKQNIYYMICHYCKESKNANEVINCTDEDCEEVFCDKCTTDGSPIILSSRVIGIHVGRINEKDIKKEYQFILDNIEE